MYCLDMYTIFNSHLGRSLARIRHHITRNRNVIVTERLLIVKTLPVVSNQNCEIFPGKVIIFAKLLNRHNNLLDFFNGIIRHPDFRFAVFLIERVSAGTVQVASPEHLAQVYRFVLENIIRQIQHVRDRTVIPFQADLSRFLEVFAKSFDVSNIGAAESVNSLIIIADYK